MQRIALDPRPDWLAKLGALGVDLEAAPASPYWREDAAYTFSDAEIETLEDAGAELLGLIDAAVAHVVAEDRFAEIGVPPPLARLARESFARREPSLYGRFDLGFDGSGPPKLLEYNADTPTALFEASVVQWHWLEERFADADQLNSIHEALIETWAGWRRDGRLGRVHFACMPSDDDDLLTTAYLQDTAHQAGLDTRLLAMPEIGWNGRAFVDLDTGRIDALFKLYPWDWLATEPFFPHIATLAGGLCMIEPAWRVIASSKGLLPILWELFPGHPNLLPAAFHADAIDGPAIVKPILGREGANIVVRGGRAEPADASTASAASLTTDGPYGAMTTIAQAFAPLPCFDGWHPVCGLWTVAGRACGLGIREDRSLVTGRAARFVPHLIR